MRTLIRAAVGVLVLAAGVVAPAAFGGSAAQAAPLPCNYVTNIQGLEIPILYPSFQPHSCEIVRGQRDTSSDWHYRPVSVLQNALVVCYNKQIAVDGDFGPRTEQALREVQAISGTAADGRYGPNTKRAIRHHQEGGERCYKLVGI